MRPLTQSRRFCFTHTHERPRYIDHKIVGLDKKTKKKDEINSTDRFVRCFFRLCKLQSFPQNISKISIKQDSLFDVVEFCGSQGYSLTHTNKKKLLLLFLVCLRPSFFFREDSKLFVLTSLSLSLSLFWLGKKQH